MQIRRIRDILDAAVLSGEAMFDEEVASGFGSDFMSDVLAYIKEQTVLLTGLVNLQVIRTAEMMDIKCVVFVSGKKPDMSIVKLAEERNVAVMVTLHNMYDACGLLYSAGLRGQK